jgi:hypothetical protein
MRRLIVLQPVANQLLARISTAAFDPVIGRFGNRLVQRATATTE